LWHIILSNRPRRTDCYRAEGKVKTIRGRVQK